MTNWQEKLKSFFSSDKNWVIVLSIIILCVFSQVMFFTEVGLDDTEYINKQVSLFQFQCYLKMFITYHPH